MRRMKRLLIFEKMTGWILSRASWNRGHVLNMAWDRSWPAAHLLLHRVAHWGVMVGSFSRKTTLCQEPLPAVQSLELLSALLLKAAAWEHSWAVGKEAVGLKPCPPCPPPPQCSSHCPAPCTTHKGQSPLKDWDPVNATSSSELSPSWGEARARRNGCGHALR